MIRLTHVTGSRAGQVDQSPNAVIRLGRASDCDIRFDGNVDRTVSSHHAEIRFDGAGYLLVDTNSSNGTLVNGARISQHQLRPGDVIFLGGDAGPQLRFEVANDFGAAAKPAKAPKAAAAPSGGPDDEVADAAAKAVMKLRQQRAQSGGQASGQTMAIMLSEIGTLVEKKESNFKKQAIIGGGVAVAIIAVIVTLWMLDRAKYSGKVDEKKNFDEQIHKLEAEIQIMDPNDPNLAGKVAQLELLSGKAAAITSDLESSAKGQQALAKAGATPAAGGDFVDSEIKKILKEFEADTYNVPRNFRDRVQYYLDDWQKKGSYKVVWNRRKQYWDMISRAFAEEGVPEVMAYVAWQESQFDPEICSWVGARGMWQFMPATGRRYGLHIDSAFDSCKPSANSYYCPCGGTDERTDPYKAAKAGARYLGDLLAEFGIESFMLAIASYNKGEDGMRRILREKKLRRRHERDFWHLYYLKLLPEETLEYVPRIVAAAIVGRNPAKFGLN